jgi:DNA-binding winged helix-turn-helix (wHTH) protein
LHLTSESTAGSVHTPTDPAAPPDRKTGTRILVTTADHTGARALIVAGDARYGLLEPLLSACGVAVDIIPPGELSAGPVPPYGIAVLSGLADFESLAEATARLHAAGDCRVVAIVPERNPKLVLDLYRAGADVVFNDSVDHYHVFLQCSYFLDVWQAEKKPRRLGGAAFEPDLRRIVLPDRTSVRLTEAESKILGLLMETGDGYLGRDTISESVFHIPYDKFDRRIDVHVSNLRRKLRESGLPVHIDTSRLNGFRLVEAASRVAAASLAG